MNVVTSVTIPLHGVPENDPRVDGLLNMIQDWAEDNEIQSPVYTVTTTSAEEAAADELTALGQEMGLMGTACVCGHAALCPRNGEAGCLMRETMSGEVSLPADLARQVLHLLTEADAMEAFGKDCSGHMDPTGTFCKVCRTMEQLETALWEAEGLDVPVRQRQEGKDEQQSGS